MNRHAYISSNDLYKSNFLTFDNSFTKVVWIKVCVQLTCIAKITKLLQKMSWSANARYTKNAAQNTV